MPDLQSRTLSMTLFFVKARTCPSCSTPPIVFSTNISCMVLVAPPLVQWQYQYIHYSLLTDLLLRLLTFGFTILVWFFWLKVTQGLKILYRLKTKPQIFSVKILVYSNHNTAMYHSSTQPYSVSTRAFCPTNQYSFFTIKNTVLVSDYDKYWHTQELIQFIWLRSSPYLLGQNCLKVTLLVLIASQRSRPILSAAANRMIPWPQWTLKAVLRHGHTILSAHLPLGASYKTCWINNEYTSILSIL